MHTLKISDQPQIVDYKLEKALSYEEYRLQVDNLAERGLTSGPIQNESLVHFTRLNSRRHKRWDKTLRINPVMLRAVQAKQLPKMTWIVLTESWCGDAAHLLPVFNKLADQLGNIELKILFRDENTVLMDNYRTDGARSIPKLIAVDTESKEELFVYGPRPFVASEMVREYKAFHGSLSDEFKEGLQQWYNKDKGQSTLDDLVKILECL